MSQKMHRRFRGDDSLHTACPEYFLHFPGFYYLQAFLSLVPSLFTRNTHSFPPSCFLWYATVGVGVLLFIRVGRGSVRKPRIGI